MSEVVFWVFAVLAIVSAIATVTRRNPVVAAVWLVATFFAVAVNYVLLSATFLAVIQVLVYAGAIMVLFVFVIMVLDVDESGATEHKRPPRIGRFGYYLAIMIAGGLLLWVLIATLSKQYITPGVPLAPEEQFGSANSVGRLLFTDYLFAFEAISLLLLAAVIGAVVVARSRREREKHAASVNMHPDAMHAAGLENLPHDEMITGPVAQTDFGEPSAGGHTGGT